MKYENALLKATAETIDEFYELIAQGYNIFNITLNIDDEEKKKLFERASMRKHPNDDYILGYCYYNGVGIERNYSQAFEHFKISANDGDLRAQNNLGLCYYDGQGVPQSYEEAVKWYRLAADQENANAQYNLGCCYYNGLGVSQSYEEAVKWYRLATNQGLARAQLNLGNCYYNGQGVPQSYEEAVKWCRLAADQGNARAQYTLGVCYYNDRGVPQSYEEAVKWYRLAADQGYADAQYNLGNCYYKGQGVPQSYEEAVKWYRLAANQGDADAQNNLGLCYDNGQGVSQSYEEAVKWYRLAANQGNARAQYNLGNCYYKGQGVSQSYEEAMKWHRLAADQGYADAQYNLGNCYYKGQGVPQSYEEAVKWYRLAADQGLVEAQYNLAFCYKYGQGVPQSYEEAVKWYRLAANQGDADAQNNLGLCYDNGQGVSQSYEEAVKWYRLAANQGNARAQYNLGNCYYKGQGVSQSYEEAMKWYRLAADQGNARAQYNLGVCYDNGQGVPQSYEEAVKWYRLAANQGNARAQYILALCHANDKDMAQSYEEAAKWWTLAANQGNARAQYNLGVYYAKGQGVPQDYKEAVKWYRLAADQGYADAQYNLGVCYAKGQGVLQDYEEASKWWTLAANQGHADAQYDLGVCYAKGLELPQSYEEASKWWKLAANQGLADAQYDLGFCYAKGQGVSQDYEEASKWWKLAANQGNAEAQYNLALCYNKGQGVPQSYEETVKWYRLSAEQGHAGAQNNLGVCYYNGLGLPQSYEEAVKWWTLSANHGLPIAQYNLDVCYENGQGIPQIYEETIQLERNIGKKESQYYDERAKLLKSAADQGYADAQYNLGVCYENGKGVPQSYEEAVKWYRLAADQGHAGAQYNLGVCYENGFGIPQSDDEAVKLYKKAADQGDKEAQLALDKILTELEIEYKFNNVGKSYDVFVSWNHNDKDFKNRLVDGIENKNNINNDGEALYTHYRAWESDRDASGVIDLCIERAIKSSKFFLIILSKYSLKSKWVKKELEIALQCVKNGELTEENLIIVYLDSEDFNVSEEIAKISDENDPFKKLITFALAGKYSDKNDDRIVTNVCAQIQQGMAKTAIRNYIYQHTKENEFKYNVQSQYSDNNMSGNPVDAFMTYEDGYIDRNIYDEKDNGFSIDEVINSKENLIIVGEGGIGKSLYLSYLMYKHLAINKFYVRINLINYVGLLKSINSIDQLLNTELETYLNGKVGVAKDNYLPTIRENGASITIIMDGLEEIDDENNEKLCKLIKAYRAANTWDRFIFTSRNENSRPVNGIKEIFISKDIRVLHLERLTYEEQKSLFDNIAKRIIKDPKPGEIGPNRERLKIDFFEELKKISDEITGNPFLLSNLIFIYLFRSGEDKNKDLPKTRYEIIKQIVDIFIHKLEDNRGVLSLFKYKDYLTPQRMEKLLGNIALRKLQGARQNFKELIYEYLSKEERSAKEHNIEKVAKEIYEYLARRAIIYENKISHDLFTSFFATYYIYLNVYQLKNKHDVYYIGFQKEGKEYFKYRLEEFKKHIERWADVPIEIIMQLDYEIRNLNDQEMDDSNMSKTVFKETLELAKDGLPDFVKMMQEYLDRQGTFYFETFIRQLLSLMEEKV